MKRLLACLLSVCFLLTACGPTDGAQDTTTTTTEEGAQTTTSTATTTTTVANNEGTATTTKKPAGVGQTTKTTSASGNRKYDRYEVINLSDYAADTEKYWFSRPASLLAGGAFPHIVNPFILEEGYEKIAFLYGCSMHVEDMLLDVFRKTEDEASVLPDAFAKKSEEQNSFETVFKDRFYTTTAMYVYLNRFQNESIEEKDGVTVLKKADGVVATYSSDPAQRTITKDGVLIRRDNDVFVPLCWKEHPAVAAYSANGYEHTTWTLLPEWEGISHVDVYDISQNGPILRQAALPISAQRTITLTLDPKQAVYIVPAGNK